MKFDKLYQLIQESTTIGIIEYANKLKSAYKLFFDLDDSDIIKVENMDGAHTSYTHNSFKVNIEFIYNSKHYKVYHSLLHLKIPYKTIQNQDKEDGDWMEFLKKLENFDYVPFTDDLLKTKNIQVRTVFSIFQIQDKTNRFGMNNRISLGSDHMFAPLGEIVGHIKSIIDKRDDSDGELQPEPVPEVPDNKLVPV